MEIIYLLIPLSIVLVVVIAAAFFWAANAGQFDDLQGPAYRVLQDDDSISESCSENRSELSDHTAQKAKTLKLTSINK